MTAALLHSLGRQRQEDGQVDGTRQGHDPDGRQRVPARKLGDQPPGPVGEADQRVPGEGQGQDAGQDGLQAKVDGEELLLDGGEAGTVDRPEHDDAIDEGLLHQFS